MNFSIRFNIFFLPYKKGKAWFRWDTRWPASIFESPHFDSFLFITFYCVRISRKKIHASYFLVIIRFFVKIKYTLQFCTSNGNGGFTKIMKIQNQKSSGWIIGSEGREFGFCGSVFLYFRLLGDKWHFSKTTTIRYNINVITMLSPIVM